MTPSPSPAASAKGGTTSDSTSASIFNLNDDDCVLPFPSPLPNTLPTLVSRARSCSSVVRRVRGSQMPVALTYFCVFVWVGGK